MMTTAPNRIEKEIQLNAPRSRVWKALTDAREFGAWFGVKFEGQFQANTPIEGKITSKGHEHVTFRCTVEAIEPQHTFSFRWIPYGIDPNVDYSKEEPTLVEFTLTEKNGGTHLKVVESGFDKTPLERRAKAFEMNDKGWAIQMTNIAKHLQNAAQ